MSTDPYGFLAAVHSSLLWVTFLGLCDLFGLKEEKRKQTSIYQMNNSFWAPDMFLERGKSDIVSFQKNSVGKRSFSQGHPGYK